VHQEIGAVVLADLQADFMMSMAVVIAVAAVIIILFHRFRQPLILGYLVAGVLVGPFVASARESIELLASLGIILLTFYIGLEFNLSRLRRLGISLIGAASLEILLMIAIGFQLGLALGWTALESTLLGAILSVASTMIIVRALRDSGRLDEERARTVVGLLVVEDFAAVLLLAAVSGLVSTGGVSPDQILGLVFRMALFVSASVVFGLAAVPRLVDYIGRQRSGELLTVTVLGLCFAMAYFAHVIGFSEAIGAFVMGTIVSESKHIGEVMRQVEPVRDLFGAVFFVTVGMLVDISLFAEIGTFLVPALIITAVFVLAKFFSCTLATFLVGLGARNALGTGLGMLAVGEFSLMIAAVAVGSPSIRETVYPTIVMVTILTAMVVPYTIRFTPRIERGLERRLPRPILVMGSYINLIVKTLRTRSKSSVRISNEMRNNISTMFVNVVIVISVLILVASIAPKVDDYSEFLGGSTELLWLLIVVLAMMFVIPAMYSIWTRSIRFVEVSTSEAMLGTRSAEYVGYTHTASTLKWALLALYLFIALVAFLPIVHSMIQENTVFTLIALGTVAVVMFTLWNSAKTVNAKLCEVFERRPGERPAELSSDLREIEDIIAAMEREGR